MSYTLMDEVHPPRKGHELRCALGYTEIYKKRISLQGRVQFPTGGKARGP